MLTFLGVAIVALLITTWRANPRLAILVLLVGGLGIRLAIRARVGSDVLDVTAAAIDRVLAGQNPYVGGYQQSIPPGAPFPYGPLAIAWYMPIADAPRMAELLSATIIATVLALRGRLLGLALYAAMPAIVNTSVDGSNDTTLGLLLFATFALAPKRPLLAGVVLAAAVAFKVSAAAWVPAFLVWGGLRVAAPFAMASLVLWAPVLLVWGPVAFLNSVLQANRLHRDIVWSLGAALQDLLGSAGVRPLEDLRLFFGIITAAVTVIRVRTLDHVIVAGTLVYLVTLFGGTWATFAYFSAVVPVLCLRIDDWLGLRSTPLVGAEVGGDAPGDPGAMPAEPPESPEPATADAAVPSGA